MSSRPIRIALDASCAMEQPMTGVGYAALYLLRALCSMPHGLDLRLFGTPDHASSRALEDLHSGFTRRCIIPNARQLKYWLWPSLNWPPIEWYCGEVDIAHNLFHQLPAARRARRLVTIHDLSFLRMPAVHTPQNVAKQTRLVRHCARFADRIIAVSQCCKQEVTEYLNVSPDRVCVVPNGVAFEEFAGELDPAALAETKQRLGLHRDYFIHLGTLEPRKNVPRLLEAYARLRRRRRDCPQLLLVGKRGWLYGPVFETRKRLGLRREVIHAGHLTRAEAVMLLRGAAACVYPSLYEGFGLPVLEAMAARIPVITSNVSSLPEVVGDTAILISPEDVEALADAMESVLDRPAEAAERVERAHTRARSFTWERSAQILCQVYAEIMGCSGSGLSG